jgi:hypothetical protein
MSSGRPQAKSEVRNRPTKRSTAAPGKSAFRLLAKQPLSLSLANPLPFEVCLQQIRCRVAIRPMEEETGAQRRHGGSFLSIDFHLPGASDLIAVTRKGIDLLEDLLSAIAVVEGATLGAIDPIQIVRVEPATRKYGFIQYLPFSHNHWDKPVSVEAMKHVDRVIAHWGVLDSGARLRRAARQFRLAVGAMDDLTAFQHAYVGLEAMEPLLADFAKIPAGVEEISGACATCGAAYTRRKTVLAGVRAYVHGDRNPNSAASARRDEWKKLNRLRQNIFHGLQDAKALERLAGEVLPAAMHYLHDAICCQSHAHSFESSRFDLVRGPKRLVLMGTFGSGKLGPLNTWGPLLGTQEPQWVEDPDFGFVPQYSIRNSGIYSLKAKPFWLQGPFSNATEANLEPARWWTSNRDCKEEEVKAGSPA